jgi:hypothetical protein
MGKVWRARDPRLGRNVAIRISAQRFNVGPNYLVMELIEGPTLAGRIAQGPIPLEEAPRCRSRLVARSKLHKTKPSSIAI